MGSAFALKAATWSMDEMRQQKKELEQASELIGRNGELCRFFESDILPLVVWRSDGRILDANDAYLGLVKCTRRNLKSGMFRWDRLTPPEYRAHDEHAIQQLLSGKPVCTPFAKEYLRADGSRVPVVVGGALFPGQQKEGIAFALDLTNHGSAEQALFSRRYAISCLYASTLEFDRWGNFEVVGLAKKQTPLRPAVPSSDAMLAHEIRQPLATILANAQSAQVLLRQEKPNVEDLRAIVRDIIAEDRRASRLIRQFTLPAARSHRAFELVEINPIIRTALGRMKRHMAEDGIRSEAALAPDLPLVRGNSGQLHELFDNLYSNARQAMEQAGTAGRGLFTRTYSENGSWLSIEIRDSGPGVPPQQLEAIFQPFVSTTKGGMGIGLYICRAIVRSHGGQIWATNRRSSGASFHISFPSG